MCMLPNVNDNRFIFVCKSFRKTSMENHTRSYDKSLYCLVLVDGIGNFLLIALECLKDITCTVA